jgi:2-oxoglutarate ferredoxin oxidoreductase subunit gamma
MQMEVRFAGFGGQGILLAGKLFAEAAMEEGKQVAWIPSYGPEMRGGTAYCTVVIADHLIGSPIVNNPGHLVVMNRPSLEKFAPDTRPGGICLVNSSLIPITSGRNDLIEVLVPCNHIANNFGNPRGANMVILGAFAMLSQAVSLETIENLVRHQFSAKPKLIDGNIALVHLGADAAADPKARVNHNAEVTA